MTVDDSKSPTGRNAASLDISVNPKKLPPPCKRCLQKFSFKRSPTCDHYFCKDCYQHQQSYTGKGADGNEVWQFGCTVCKEQQRKERDKQDGESETRETQEAVEDDASSDQPQADPVEIFDKNVKRVGYLELRAPNSKRPMCRPKTFISSQHGDLVLLNDADHELVVVHKDGQVRKKWTYMRSSTYQGGIAVSVDDKVVLSLRNEKYSTVGYYSLDGKFLFSAFLDTSARVPALCCTGKGDIVALNAECDELQVINQQKLITKSSSVLKKGEMEFDVQGASMVTNSMDDIIICSPVHQVVRSFNSDGLYQQEFSISQIFTGREPYSCPTLPDSRPGTPMYASPRLETTRISVSPRHNSPRILTPRASLHTPVLPATPEEPEDGTENAKHGKHWGGRAGDILNVRGSKEKPCLNGSVTHLTEATLEEHQKVHRLALAVDCYDNLLIADRLYGTVYRYSPSGVLIDVPIQSVNENDQEKRWIIGLATGESGTFSLVLERLYNGPELRTYVYRTARKFRSKPKGGDGKAKSTVCTIL